ncbi:MAG: hypothetical protein Q9163_001025 [Psora crenata]
MAHSLEEYLHLKRKRPDVDELILQVQGGPIRKWARIALPDNAIRSKEDVNDVDVKINPQIDFDHEKVLFLHELQSGRQAKVSIHKLILLRTNKGFLSRLVSLWIIGGVGPDITDDCKQLCTTLADAQYEPPKDSLFEGDLFWKILDRVRSKNEPRVVRDISPLLIPSAELLSMRGLLEIEYLIEEIQADWTKCVPLVGPLPKPDLTVGFQSSAFTDDEMERLRYHSTPAKPTLFTGELYFPFLTCEIKWVRISLPFTGTLFVASISATAMVRKSGRLITSSGRFTDISPRFIWREFKWLSRSWVAALCRSCLFTNSGDDSELPDLQETASAPASQNNEVLTQPMLPPIEKQQKNVPGIAMLQHELKLQREEANRLREESRQQCEEANRLREESKQHMQELKELIETLRKG